MKKMTRICKNERCENEVIGRTDRLFCSSCCKSDYHTQNRKKSQKTYFKLEVDDVLRRNRSILAKYNIKSKVTVRKEVLFAEGFNPRIFTHYWKSRAGETYLFCYDQGYKTLKEETKEKFLLVTWQPVMAKQVFGGGSS